MLLQVMDDSRQAAVLVDQGAYDRGQITVDSHVTCIAGYKRGDGLSTLGSGTTVNKCHVGAIIWRHGAGIHDVRDEKRLCRTGVEPTGRERSAASCTDGEGG